MQELDTTRQVGELVTERPSRSRVLERLGIDYCCGGRRPLAEACAALGLNLADVVAQLAESDAAVNGQEGRDWSRETMTALADHIESTHHAYLKEELPRLEQMVEKVASVHGGTQPWLLEARRTFCGLVEELSSHMWKEEQILFPICRQLEATDGPARFHCGSVNNPIRVMEHEHDQAGAAVRQLRELSDGFTPPEGACNTFRALLDGWQTLERDLHQHIHKENNILFPRAAEAEAALAARA